MLTLKTASLHQQLDMLIRQCIRARTQIMTGNTRSALKIKGEKETISVKENVRQGNSTSIHGCLWLYLNSGNIMQKEKGLPSYVNERKWDRDLEDFVNRKSKNWKQQKCKKYMFSFFLLPIRLFPLLFNSLFDQTYSAPKQTMKINQDKNDKESILRTYLLFPSVLSESREHSSLDSLLRNDIYSWNAESLSTMESLVGTIERIAS